MPALLVTWRLPGVAIMWRPTRNATVGAATAARVRSLITISQGGLPSIWAANGGGSPNGVIEALCVTRVGDSQHNSLARPGRVERSERGG